MFHDKDQITFASPLPSVKPRYLALTQPLGMIVWVMTAVMVIITGVILYAVSTIEVILL